MGETRDASGPVAELVRRLDGAVAAGDIGRCTTEVKAALERLVGAGDALLPEAMLRPVAGRYARRLLHRDSLGRYSVIVMVWDVGQGTPIHDHAGMWCVECVHRGAITVRSYAHRGEDGDTVELELERRVVAGPGQAGALIPPFDYHTIHNEGETLAATVHVYGGDMTWCHTFLPRPDGRFVRERRSLELDP